MRSWATLLLLVVVAGCTAHNPDFIGGSGGAGGTGGGDLAGAPPADLAGAGASFDLSGPMGVCTVGQRMCAGTVASDRCEGGMFVVDRSCPAGSECAKGYCGAPATMLGTQVGLRCDANGGPQQLQCMASASLALSCQPFVEPANKNLRWLCDNSVGSGKGGAHCTHGNECRSGVCASIGTCFDACQRDQDCTLLGTGTTCRSVDITVEGETVTAKSCA